MASCQMEVNLSGEALNPFGIPTRLRVWGRILSGQCQRVEFTVRVGPGGVVLISGQALTDSNGTWSAGFPMPVISWPCGSSLWAEARCVSGGDCSTARTARVECKDASSQPTGPGTGGGGSGGNGGDGQNGGSTDWPWPWPPHIWCPLLGHTFTAMLLAAVATILAGAAMGNTAVTAVGIALVSAASAAFVLWRRWCVPNWCYVLGAIFWVLGRATLAGMAATLVTLSVSAGVWTLIFGSLAAIINIVMLRLRCARPSLATPLNQLPVW